MASYQPLGCDEHDPVVADTNNDRRQRGEDTTRSHSYGTVHGIEEEALEVEEGRVAKNTILDGLARPRLVAVACLAAALFVTAAWDIIRSGRVSPKLPPSGTPPIMETCVKPPVLWADEFDGSEIDLDKWAHQDGDGCDIGLCGWGNSELEWYSQDNLRMDDGHLVIEARIEVVTEESPSAAAESESGAASQHRYTSSKILSKGNGDFGSVGRFEARMRLPRGNGVWPAFWMLPTNDVYGTWPKSGEIDIMENIGKEGPNTIHGTIHYGQDSPKDQYSEEGIHLDEELHDDFSENFHIFAVEREEGIIRWFVDDILYSTKTSSDIAPYMWPFDEHFYFVFNLAIGGNWPGNPDNTTVFPQQMAIDYVRVYGGMFPRIDGKDTVLSGEPGVEFSFVGGGATNFSWSVPNGANITEGQGTNSITVTFGQNEGIVSLRWDWASVHCSDGQGSARIRVKVIDGAKLKSYPFDCGRPETCTKAVLNRDADGHSCGDRIQWLVEEMGRTEKEACAIVSYEECNGRCSSCFPS